MLKTIRIENFKAFGSPQDLPLAPITLIYGPNSAGKSSIIQTLLLMHQSLQGISQAATRLVFSGEYVDLGTYLSALFRHESSLRMKLGFSFTAPKPVSRGLTNHVFSRQSIRNIDLTIDLTSSARREKRGDAQIVECNYSLDDGQVFQVKLKRKEESKGSADYNDYDVDKSPSEFQILDKISLVKFAEFISNLSSGKNQRDSKHNKLTNDDSKAPLNRVLIQELKNLKILPIGLLPSRIAFNSEVDSFTTFFDTIGPEISRHLFGPNSPLEVLRKEFHNKIQSISYLGPLRSHPARHYIISGADKETVGTKGERTPQLLYRRKRDMEPRINQKFEDFGINYKIGVESAGTPQTGEIISIVLTDKNGIRVSPSDVGFGIGQLLPILVEGSVSSGRIICVEQPEVHLHPRLQAHIADFLIETAKTRSTTPNRSGSAKEFGGNQWIIETHSEALMLRLQKRIKSGLPPEFVSVLYVEQLDNGQSRVKRLRLDENGEFIDEWPDGFFEEGYNEIFGRN